MRDDIEHAQQLGFEHGSVIPKPISIPNHNAIESIYYFLSAIEH